MKLLLAILITFGLLAASDLFSTLIYFDLIWILIASTSFWAAIDSKQIGLQRYKLAISCRPILLFGVCSLLWVFIFPWYLWARFKIKAGEIEFKEETFEENGKNKSFFRRCLQKAARVVEYTLLLFVITKLALWLFFTVESWRAPRIWANYTQQLEAKGESLDWNNQIPPPVPASQNFFEAPMMSEWFVKPTGGVHIGQDLQFLKGYRLMHNKYPDTLDELVPQFINQLPHDIIDGQSLKYQPTSNSGFVLYSIGWDQTGNGDQYKPSVNGQDWIWL